MSTETEPSLRRSSLVQSSSEFAAGHSNVHLTGRLRPPSLSAPSLFCSNRPTTQPVPVYCSIRKSFPDSPSKIVPKRKMADELELEFMEIEMLESNIRRLKLQNQAQSEEKEGQRSTVTSLEAANDDLISRNQRLVEENERLEKANKILQRKEERSWRRIKSLRIHQRDLTEEITELKSALDLDKYREELREHLNLRREKEEAEKRIDRVSEVQTEVILAMQMRQRVLEMELEEEDRIMKSFHQKILMMVRETARMMEEGHVDGDDFEMSVPEGKHSAVEVMLQSFAVELAGVKRAYMRVAHGCSDLPKVECQIDDWKDFLSDS